MNTVLLRVPTNSKAAESSRPRKQQQQQLPNLSPNTPAKEVRATSSYLFYQQQQQQQQLRPKERASSCQETGGPTFVSRASSRSIPVSHPPHHNHTHRRPSIAHMMELAAYRDEVMFTRLLEGYQHNLKHFPKFHTQLVQRDCLQRLIRARYNNSDFAGEDARSARTTFPTSDDSPNAMCLAASPTTTNDPTSTESYYSPDEDGIFEMDL